MSEKIKFKITLEVGDKKRGVALDWNADAEPRELAKAAADMVERTVQYVLAGNEVPKETVGDLELRYLKYLIHYGINPALFYRLTFREEFYYEYLETDDGELILDQVTGGFRKVAKEWPEGFDYHYFKSLHDKLYD